MRRYLTFGVTGVLLVAAALWGVLEAGRASARDRAPASAAARTWRLIPADLSGLKSAQSRVAGVPDHASMIGPSYTPAPGEVHQVGPPSGSAFAWLHGSQVCYVRPTSGGCVPVLEAPISLARGDPDIVGRGQPTYVGGFAIDEVARVVVTLADGTTVAGAPVRNFFHLELPDGVPPWGAAKVEAVMADGSTYTERLPTSGPPAS